MGAAQNGTLDLQGTAPGFITQVTSPISGFGKAMKFGNAGCGATSCTQQGTVRILDPAGAFTPGPNNFEWGATVQLTGLPTGMGMNVIQKGRSGINSPDMWKLQLDGGKASCVVKVDGAASAQFGKASTPQALTVGHNYKLRCKRVNGVLTLTVTEFAANGSQIGAPVVHQMSPGGVSAGDLSQFGPDDAVYVGAKGTLSSPDQLRDTILDTVTYWAG